MSGPLVAQVRLGLVEGLAGSRGFKTEFGQFGHEPDRLTRNAAEFVRREVAVLLAFSNKAALVAKSLTSTIPIVCLADDPVASGLVECPDRPGGNLTGAFSPVAGLIATRIDIIRGMVPGTQLIVLITDPTNSPAHEIEVREAQAAANALGFELSIVAWVGEHNIEIELSALPRDRNAVLVFGGGPLFAAEGATLAYQARRYEFPAIHGDRDAVEKGGLVSYGPRFLEAGHLMGVYAGRILKGERPADLPVRQVGRELIVNRFVAKSRGLPLPATLLARADEVID
ncbi:ABC transporter substrate-binding protein [Bradyrhizobium liaoningense]|nr:ABC transporter substrate-binding protein [Bradyrhizobium liaoningense]